MRVLIVKTSSMGDVIHTLPALTDAGKALPGITFDWVVGEAFVEIPQWHPLVKEVIPIAWRRWRKQLTAAKTRCEWRQFRKRLQENQYDLIIDAQGLIKSAFITFLASGLRSGPNWSSAREPLASLAYKRKYQVSPAQHAIVRMRTLFSQALAYPLPDTIPDYGVARKLFQQAEIRDEKYLVFLHGTTWTTKLWPEAYWLDLAKIAEQAGYRIKMGGGNPEEVARAKRISQQCPAVDVKPYLAISGMARLLATAQAVVAVDTGFAHLAAALGVPGVSLYGPTDPALTGALGRTQVQLATSFACSPCLSRTCTYAEKSLVTPACFSTLPPPTVWAALQKFL